ncbi:hypothetical protein [Gloeomargarita lithophora]|nr:hypothetical protein [Gloeomargarita lithophora]
MFAVLESPGKPVLGHDVKPPLSLLTITLEVLSLGFMRRRGKMAIHV